MGDPESTSEFDPWFTIPLPGDSRLNPFGLFDSTPNNIFIPDAPGRQALSPEALATLSKLQPGYIPGAAPYPTGGVLSGGDQASAEQVSAIIDALMQIGMSEDEAVNLLATDPGLAFKLLDNAGIPGFGSGSGGRAGPTQLSMITGADGSVFSWNPVSGQMVKVGQFDELAASPDLALEVDVNGNLVGIDPQSGAVTTLQTGFRHPTQDPAESIIKNAMTGESIRINSRTGETTSLGQFDFPDIDPEREFSRLAAGTEAANEVARRGAQLNEQKEVSRLLSSPTDFLARAFATRGEEFSGTKMTAADLINALRGGIDGEIARSDLSHLMSDRFGGTYAPPPVAAAPLPVATPPPPPTVAPATEWRHIPEKAGTAVPEWLNTSRLSRGLPELAEGGRLRGAGVVGDSSDGKENREVVIGDAIVIPEDQAIAMGIQTSRLPEHQNGGIISPEFPIGTSPEHAATVRRVMEEMGVTSNQRAPTEAEAAAFSAGGQGVPTTLTAYDTYVPPKSAVAPTYTPPTAPARTPYTPVTQEELIALARTASPPAVSNIVEGRGEETNPLDLGFKAFSPRQLSRLTNDEVKALGTRLAAEFDVTLEDVGAQQSQLYGPSRSVRRGRLVR